MGTCLRVLLVTSTTQHFVCASLFLSGNPFFSVCLFVLRGHRAVAHLGERSGGEISPRNFFKMSSRRNAPLLLRLRAKARSSIFSPAAAAAAHPHQNVSAKSRRFVFASRRQLLSPKVQSPVLCTRRNPQRVLDPRQLFSRRANKCSPAKAREVQRRPAGRGRGVYMTRGLGQQIAVRGKTKWRHYSPPPLPENH